MMSLKLLLALGSTVQGIEIKGNLTGGGHVVDENVSDGTDDGDSTSRSGGGATPRPRPSLTEVGGSEEVVEEVDFMTRFWWRTKWTLATENVVRMNAFTLPKDIEERIVKAVVKMAENTDGPGTSQYFRLAMVHGGTHAPGTGMHEIPDVTFPDGVKITAGQRGFCVHGPVYFAIWHRVYMLDFENVMRKADMELGNDGQIGLPYWDWSNPDYLHSSSKQVRDQSIF